MRNSSFNIRFGVRRQSEATTPFCGGGPVEPKRRGASLPAALQKLWVLSLLLAASFAACFLAGLHRATAGTPPSPNKPLVIECRGSVRPGHELIVRLRGGERVLAVHSAAGKTVKTGAPLVEIFDAEGWTRLLELKRARLEAEVSSAELKSKQARLARLGEELEAQMKLWQQVDAASAERRVAALRDKKEELAEQVELLRLKTASASALDAEQIKSLAAHLASPLIRAPFDGAVAYLAPNPSRLSPGETVLEFWDTNLVVRAEVLQHQLGYISKGARAEVSLDFSDEKPVGASVEGTEMIAETRAGEVYPSFAVRLTLDSGAHRLKPGMRVSVRLRVEQGKADRVLP